MSQGHLRRQRGEKARRDGRLAEWVAALWLILQGYRIVGFRVRTPFAEIDLLARKAGVLAVIEVKLRSDLVSAVDAVHFAQRRRLRRAARALVVQRPAWSELSIRLDLLALAPGRLPVHLKDAWPDEVD